MQVCNVQTSLSSYSVPIAQGAVYRQEIFYDSYGKRIQAHILLLEPSSGIRISSALPDDKDLWGMQKTSHMAQAANDHQPGVIGAVNADFFNMTNGCPEGVFIRDGIIFKDDMPADRHFFGITYSGSFVIGDLTDFLKIRDNLQTAVGGRDVLVWEGNVQEPVIEAIPVRHPRTAVCIMPDGLLMFVVIDGRTPLVSEGMTLPQFSEYLRDLGAAWALNLDGGGSSTFVLRMPGEDKLRQINLASDGTERECADSLVVRSLIHPDGVCAKAWIAPFQPLILKGATVPFCFTGLDVSGAACAISGKVQWRVIPEGAGVIDENGVFTAGLDDCQAEILLLADEKVLGRNLIQIVDPDELKVDERDLLLPDMENCTVRVYAYKNSLPVFLSSACLSMDAEESLGQVVDGCTLKTGKEGATGNITIKVKSCGVQAAGIMQIGRLPISLDVSQDAAQWKTENAVLEPAAFPDVYTRTEHLALRVSTRERYASFTGRFHLPRPARAVGVWVYAAYGPVPSLYLSALTESGPADAAAMRGIPVQGSHWHYFEADLPLLKVKPDDLQLRFDVHAEPGSIFLLDGLRAIFSVKHDDLTMPEVKSISVRKRTNQLYNLTVRIGKDMAKPYATPIAYERMRVIIGDMEYTGQKGHYGINRGNSTIMLHNIPIADGPCALKVCAADCFGNQVWKEYLLTSAMLAEKEFIL